MITSSYSFLSQLITNSNTTRDQLTAVQEQTASGRVSDTYSGLGNQAYTSLSLSPTLAHTAVWTTNVSAAQSRLDVTQDAMTAISKVASDFYAKVDTYNLSDPTVAQSLAVQAQTALSQVGDLLNTKSGDIYVFAGQDTDNPPVPNTDPTVMATALTSGTGSAPFSSTITSTVPKIEVGEGQYVQVGLLANTNTLATSSGTTTGSYMRDTLTALAKIAGLSTSSTASADITSARAYLTSSISAMSTEQGSLGNIQSQLTSRQSNLTSISTTLSKQLSDVQDADVAAALTKASSLELQLKASYQIVSEARSLSLADYL